MTDAHYLCLACHHEWHGQPGPTECQNCGHLYVKWLNFKEQKVERRKKVVSAWSGHDYDVAGLDEFIERLQEIRESIPEAYRSETIVELDSEYESSTVTIEVRYPRPETDEELDERLEREAAYKKRTEEEERVQFKRLLEKYGRAE